MALTNLEYGSIASSQTLNNNFQYLQTKITELSSLITSQTSSFSSTVATLNSNITNLLNCDEFFVPTGAIISYQNATIPDGYLLCDGSDVLISEYEDLYEVIGTTYGQSDSTNFRLPNLTGKTLFGKSTSTLLGATLGAGLPNITGTLSASSGAPFASGNTGLFTTSGSGSVGVNWTTYGAGTLTFDASQANSIYGNSTTVQPPAVVTNFIIKY